MLRTTNCSCSVLAMPCSVLEHREACIHLQRAFHIETNFWWLLGLKKETRTIFLGLKSLFHGHCYDLGHRHGHCYSLGHNICLDKATIAGTNNYQHQVPKMTRGTRDVRSNKSLTLLTLTFDMWHLTFDIWTFEHLNTWTFEHLNIWTFQHFNISTFEHWSIGAPFMGKRGGPPLKLHIS